MDVSCFEIRCSCPRSRFPFKRIHHTATQQYSTDSLIAISFYQNFSLVRHASDEVSEINQAMSLRSNFGSGWPNCCPLGRNCSASVSLFRPVDCRIESVLVQLLCRIEKWDKRRMSLYGYECWADVPAKCRKIPNLLQSSGSKAEANLPTYYLPGFRYQYMGVWVSDI